MSFRPNERDAAQRDNAILEQRIAESGSTIESAVETIREMKTELSAARASLAAERTLRESFGGHLRTLADAYDMAPGGAFEPADVVAAAVEARAKCARLSGAVRLFGVHDATDPRSRWCLWRPDGALLATDTSGSSSG